MSKNSIEAIYVLSPAQQGMLFHSLYAPESGIYFIQVSGPLIDLELPAFEHAWQEVIARHSILRTAFIWKRQGKAHQVVFRDAKLLITHSDWRDLSEAEQQIQIEAHLKADRQQGFDFAKAPVMRLALMRVSENTYRFC